MVRQLFMFLRKNTQDVCSAGVSWDPHFVMQNFKTVCSYDVVSRVENHFITFFQFSLRAYSFGNLTQANLTQFNILKEKKKDCCVRRCHKVSRVGPC